MYMYDSLASCACTCVYPMPWRLQPISSLESHCIFCCELFIWCIPQKSRQHTLFLYMYIQLNLDFVRNFSHIQCKWSKSTARIGHSKYRRKKQEWLCIQLNIVTVLLSKQNKYSKTRIINDLQPYYHEDKLLILYTFCWLFQNWTEESKPDRVTLKALQQVLYLVYIYLKLQSCMHIKRHGIKYFCNVFSRDTVIILLVTWFFFVFTLS